MYQHLLVPLDGSPASEPALEPAGWLASRTSGHITLLHLVERGAPPSIHGERHLRHREEADAYLRQIAQHHLPVGLVVNRHVHEEETEDVAAGIANHIAELNPDTILMCAHGRRGVRELLFGSLAQQVVARATAPLFLVRVGARREPERAGRPPAAFPGWKQILVPDDGRPTHEPSFPVAADLARLSGAKIHLLTAVPTLGTLAGAESAAGSLLPRATRATLALAEVDAAEGLKDRAARLRAQGVQTAFEVARGDPVRCIQATAERIAADLIVLATHGKAGAEAFWANSLAAKVSNRCPITVLLVPATKNEND